MFAMLSLTRLKELDDRQFSTASEKEDVADHQLPAAGPLTNCRGHGEGGDGRDFLLFCLA